ncbi:hypothetical protein BDN72DRAFT_810612 [Pluteus cervinus]|uniref:Uncharacterized protein n=1 Tax=Pluteus cervinus TaxID=181527 RepID=A0ACD3BDG3_9AGAR|nr:hypothetical protein BDN72DRAFT_810612 [Pluteus cervinus]
MPQMKRGILFANTSDLPPPSAVQEKLGRFHVPWTRTIFLPLPGLNRRLRVIVPNVALLRGGRRRGPLLVSLACIALVCTVVIMSRGFGGAGWGNSGWNEQWNQDQNREPSTLVFRREELKKIWKWEIESGHFPSSKSIPRQIGLSLPLENPAIPPQQKTSTQSTYYPWHTSRGAGGAVRVAVEEPAGLETIGIGPKRVYLDIQNSPPDVAYPPRPIPGSVADMDIVMKYCDFSKEKYVRDCLEVLRLGGGLDNGQRVRRGSTDDWKYIYVEQPDGASTSPDRSRSDASHDQQAPVQITEPAGADPDLGLIKKKAAEWETDITLPPTLQHHPASTLPTPCDPENPRVYHMFWTGPFTDKPYLAILSFLFTQNTGIHFQDAAHEMSNVCRPQFWMWINPGPAASVPNPNALRDMYNGLKASPWAAPFLHPRFKDVVQFKLWNTTEQLDGIPEIKDEWRALQDALFNSGGHIISVKKKAVSSSNTSDSTSTSSKASDEDDILNRAGSKSSSSYDRLSVILSDMARFVLCHRFGGIYLDADTILLRDWEEMWGWKGAFAYRWSRLPKYNTAVLRMNKGSALGTFLFRTALKNGLDFHPMTVSNYVKDAYLEDLLLRLPDALFDSAWLNTEYYQRDRPPQPYFTEFADFFDTPVVNSAAPQALGFNGFFKGAYSYHFHNFWWKPFDPARNWPDLGPRFIAGEMAAREALEAADAINNSKNLTTEPGSSSPETSDRVDDDKRDLDWSIVLKRTFEAYIRGERPNMYGEWIRW